LLTLFGAFKVVGWPKINKEKDQKGKNQREKNKTNPPGMLRKLGRAEIELFLYFFYFLNVS
jgi:hypothetical protein